MTTEKLMPLSVAIGDALDAAVDGRGVGVEHLKALRLADAAPALLKALKGMLGAFEEYAEEWDPESEGVIILKEARAAITKAEAGEIPEVNLKGKIPAFYVDMAQNAELKQPKTKSLLPRRRRYE